MITVDTSLKLMSFASFVLKIFVNRSIEKLTQVIVSYSTCNNDNIVSCYVESSGLSNYRSKPFVIALL